MQLIWWSLVLIIGFNDLFDNIDHHLIVGAIEVVFHIVSPDIGIKGYGNTEDILKYATDLKNYGLEAENVNSLTFEVKSCRDTSVYLANSETFDSSLSFYNIYLGGSINTWSAIRIRKQSLNTSKFVDGSHLGCTEYKPFWTSWSQGLVSFDTGDVVGNNILAEWEDLEPFDINGIGISTGYGGTGKWKIPINVSDNFEGFFNDCQRLNVRVESYITLSMSINQTGCALMCGMDSSCIGFNYSKSNHRCEMISPSLDILTDIPFVDSIGWEVNLKCYKGTGVCIGCFF